MGRFDCKHHFQQYFSFIVADSFIGGGNQSIRRNYIPATIYIYILLKDFYKVQCIIVCIFTSDPHVTFTRYFVYRSNQESIANNGV
jgi:hypothetical protein